MNKILRMLFTAVVTAAIVTCAFLLFHRHMGFWTMALIVILVPIGFWISQTIIDKVTSLFNRDNPL